MATVRLSNGDTIYDVMDETAFVGSTFFTGWLRGLLVRSRDGITWYNVGWNHKVGTTKHTETCEWCNSTVFNSQLVVVATRGEAGDILRCENVCKDCWNEAADDDDNDEN